MDKRYLDACEKKMNIKLCIVGRDPYPNNAIGIPFCKSSWSELKDKRIAGYHIIKSFFGDFNFNNPLHETPRETFMELIDFGVVFLNASYAFLNKEYLNKNKHNNFVRESFKINKRIMEKSKIIFLTGDAFEMIKWVSSDYIDKKYKVPHPSLQGRNAMKDKDEWLTYWEKGKLSKYIQGV